MLREAQNTVTARTRGWTLAPQSFDRLLQLLDADRERAGDKYELIRARLIRIFEWRGCQAPDTLADETFDRVSRRLEKGEQIRAADSAVYLHGVARDVSKEFWTDQRKESGKRMSKTPPRDRADETPEQRERNLRLACLDRCTEKLPVESRRLIETYFRAEAGRKIADRAELARRVGIPAGTLRIRAHRIRRTLEACVNDCMRAKLGK